MPQKIGACRKENKQKQSVFNGWSFIATFEFVELTVESVNG
jgi:hypothetical protein